MFITSASLNNLQVDGAFVYNQPPMALPGLGVPTSLSGMVGTGSWGKPNTPLPATAQNFGSYANCGADPYSIITEALFANALSNNNIAVRVTDQTDVAATATTTDSGGTNGVEFIAVNTGKDGDTISVTYQTGTNSTTSEPTLTAAIQRQGYAPEIYPNLTNPTGGGFAAALIDAVNNGITGTRGPSQLVTAVQAVAASTLAFNASTQPVYLSGGTNGASFPAVPAAPAAPAIAVVGTAGTTQYQYEVVASGNGDSAPSPAGQTSTANATLDSSNYNTVTWTAVPGAIKYKILRQTGGAGGYQLLATVSANVTTLQDQGQYTPSGYTAATNVTPSQAQYGTDGIIGRTGLFALKGTGIQQFILCGNTDSTQYANLATFGQSYGSLPIAAFPSGTDTETAKTTKQTGNFTSQYGAIVKDWLYFKDPNTGSQRLVSPLGEALGLIASLPPEASPGNKPIGGLTNFSQTERTGTPYDENEARELQGAGILYFTNPIPRGPIYGFAHGQNASTSVVGVNNPTGNINYTRMMNYLGASIVGFLGPYVDELQGTSANDPTRAAAKTSLTQWLQTLKDQGRIDDYRVTLDLSNNTPLTIAEGFGIALVQVAIMNTVKFWLCTLQGGSAVQISFGNTPSNSFLQAA